MTPVGLAHPLSALSRASLLTLCAEAQRFAHTAPMLVAWIEQATVWEMDRRRGRRNPLHMPSGIVSFGEAAESLAALAQIQSIVDDVGTIGSEERAAVAKLLSSIASQLNIH